MSPPRGERGSAGIWVLACAALLLAVALAVSVRSLGVLARHRAESSADLAALAAAGRIGTAGDECVVAAEIARANHADVRRCTVALDLGGRSGTVLVLVLVRVSLPVIGDATVTASARAGRVSESRPGERESPG